MLPPPRSLATLLGSLCALSLWTGCRDKAPVYADAGPADSHVPGDSNVGDDGNGSGPDGADVDVPDGSTPKGPVRIVNGVLHVGGTPFTIRGVAWNPIPVGGVHPNDLDYAGFVGQDAPLMRAAGINVVRTYSALTNRSVLDTLHAHGIFVLNTVYAWGGDAAEEARPHVRAVADHPAILMWLVGNEWNYNGLYAGLSHAESLQRVKDVIAVIRSEDTTHPIATVYGALPDTATIEALPEVNAWGINYYFGPTFGDSFNTWSVRSAKPMFFSEFGADAWNAKLPAEDQQAQADATVALVGEIAAHSAAAGRGPCLGGTLFEWADEWWKDGAGSPSVHDVGGVAPGGGPHPDQVYNEEWWGIVQIDRTPRLAYHKLVDLWGR